MHRFSALLLAFLLAGCGIATEVTHLPGHDPGRTVNIDASEVRFYSETAGIECEYDRVALLTSEHTPTASRNEVIRRTKPEAIKVGGNALVFREEKDETIAGHGKTSFLVVYEKRPCSTSAR